MPVFRSDGELLRPNIADEMECPVCGAVRMTIKQPTPRLAFSNAGHLSD